MARALFLELGTEKVRAGPHPVGTGCLSHPLHQCCGAADCPGFHQVGQHRNVFPGLFLAIFHRAHAVPDDQPYIPEQGEECFQLLLSSVFAVAQ